MDRNRQHKWTTEEREFLCILLRWFKTAGLETLDKVDKWKIFYARFSNVLFDAADLQNNLTTVALRSQFEQMKTDEHPIWQNVCLKTSFRNPTRRIRAINEVILKIAQVFELQVVLRTEDPTSLMARSPGSRSRKKVNLLGTWDGTSAQDYYSTEKATQRERTTTPEMMIQDPSPCQESDHEDELVANETSNVLPLTSDFNFKDRFGRRVRPFFYDPHRVEMHKLEGSIGFRTWDETNHGINTETGFWAGQLSSTFTPAPDRNSASWAKGINVHLRPLSEPSPWISIWMTLLPAVHRLLHSETSKLTFIDADYLARDTTSAYPKIYSAGTAIKQYQLRKIPYPDGRPYNYKGGSEFIVWQDIEHHAIISTISRQAFSEHLKVNPDLKIAFALEDLGKVDRVYKLKKEHLNQVLFNKRIGRAVGMFLTFAKIPRRFISKTAVGIAHSWTFNKDDFTCGPDFLEGVWESFNGTMPDQSESEMIKFASQPHQIDGVGLNEPDDEWYEVGEDTSDDESLESADGEEGVMNKEAVSLPGDSHPEDTNGQPPISPEDWMLVFERSIQQSADARNGAHRPSSHLSSTPCPTPPHTPPRAAVELRSVPSLSTPPATPNDKAGGKFSTVLFQKHIAAHEEREKDGFDPVSQLRKRIKRYRFDGKDPKHERAGDSPRTAIDLETVEGCAGSNSLFPAGPNVVNLSDDGSEAVETSREPESPTPSNDSFIARRRCIETIVGLSPYTQPTSGTKRKGGC